MKKLRVAWHSSLRTDIFSKSHYFSSILLPQLRERFDIELFTDGFEELPGYRTNHFLSAELRHQKEPFDIFFYQVENGTQFHFLRSALGLHPGVTLFHDYYMTDLGPDPLTNSPWELVIDKLGDPSIAWPERETEFPRTGPQARREVGLTRVPVFTSARVHNDYQREFGVEKLSWHLPMPVLEERMLRAVPSGDQLRIAFCGRCAIEDRAHKLFMALHDLKTPATLSWLIDASEQDKAEELLKEFRIKNAEIIVGRNPEQWGKVAAEASVCVHTLFSVFGSTEPYLLQSMMQAKPCIVTDFADATNLPSDTVWKIRPGDTESTEIRYALEAIQKDGRLLVNEVARQFALENHGASIVAKELGLLFERSMEALRSSEEQWKILMQSASDALAKEQSRYLLDWNKEQIKSVYHELGWS